MQNNKPLKFSDIPKPYIVLAIVTVLYFLTLGIFKASSEYSTKNRELSYKQLQDDLNKTKSELESLKAEDTKRKSLTDVYKKCPPVGEDGIFSINKKFFLYRDNGSYTICERLEDGNLKMYEYYQSRIQHENTLVITTKGRQLFYSNLTNKTLGEINEHMIPDIDQYFTVAGTLQMWFYGPQEENTDWFSPDGKLVLFGVGTCTNCDTVPVMYVLNLQNGELTRLGETEEFRWLNNNTVTWEEVKLREKEDEEMTGPYDYPLIREKLGTKTLTVK